MRPSRGMGDIRPSKMPKGARKKRRDDTDFEGYAKGGMNFSLRKRRKKDPLRSKPLRGME